MCVSTEAPFVVTRGAVVHSAQSRCGRFDNALWLGAGSDSEVDAHVKMNVVVEAEGNTEVVMR